LGILLGSGKCTLHELKTIYTLEDAYIILEADLVPKINENIATKRMMDRAKIARKK